ncbi:4-hydroxybenzoate octaprenyltransferase [Falsihalocynthiibacter sp. S25ZX9]|uniref:4-hydroxybenzoate octaprenyltransferase n=1 Tax=Falsihalocynthiibacter sp. S25ZX9 TaxID=3240870 RepID=UPI00351037C6
MPDTPEIPEANAPKSAAPVQDAPVGNWVDLFAPEATRPYLRLSRADRPIGAWLLYIPCLWGVCLAMLSSGSASFADLWIAVGCGLGAFLMRGAGCTWNDISDRNFDGLVERTKSRPIPSGQVSVRGALIWMVAQVAISALILFSFPLPAIILGIVALVPVAIYPFAKRFTWWPQVFLGIAFNWGALVAYVAHTGVIDGAVIALYLAGITWTLFYDTIYAHQDKEDDAMIGIKSTALLFGDRTRFALRYFLMGTVGLMGLAVILATAPRENLLLLVVALGGPWALGWHLAWQMRLFDGDDVSMCLRLFRSNREAGLLPVLFFAACLFL